MLLLPVPPFSCSPRFFLSAFPFTLRIPVAHAFALGGFATTHAFAFSFRTLDAALVHSFDSLTKSFTFVKLLILVNQTIVLFVLLVAVKETFEIPQCSGCHCP